MHHGNMINNNEVIVDNCEQRITHEQKYILLKVDKIEFRRNLRFSTGLMNAELHCDGLHLC